MREVSHSKINQGSCKDILGTLHFPHNWRIQNGGIPVEVSPQQTLCLVSAHDLQFLAPEE